MNYEQPSGIIDLSIFETALDISSEVIWVLHVQENGIAEYSWLSSASNRSKFSFPEGKTTYDFRNEHLYSADKERVLRDFQTAYSNPSLSYFEHQYRIHGNHESFLVLDKMQFQRGPDGSVKKVVGVLRSISDFEYTQKDLAEEELRQVNQQLLQNIIEFSEREFILNESQRLAKIASWDYDMESKTMFWSNEMYTIYGVDKSFKLPGLVEMFQLYDPNSIPIFSQIFTNPESLPIDITAQLTTPVGHSKWVRITAHPILEEGVLKRIVGLTYDITHSKESEERLIHSEEKFAKAFQNNPDLMTIHRESDLLIIDVNKHVERVSGYPREELVGKIARDFNFFENIEDREIFYNEYRKDGAASIETQWKKKDNSIITVEITSTRVEINGESYSLNSIKDITSQKADKEKFQKAFDLSPDLMMIFRERDRLLIDVNTKLEAISGYSREEIIGKSSSDFTIWVNNEDQYNYFTELSHSDSISMDAYFRKKTGEYFWGVISTSRIQLYGENHFLTVVRDVTEKKLAADRIRENEAKLNAIINNTDLRIWSIDTEYKLTIFNNAFNDTTQHTFGRKYETGMHLLHDTRGFLQEEHIEFWRQLYNRAFTGEIVSEEYEIDGIVSHTSLHPIFDTGKVIGASIYSRDITEQKRAEQKLQLSEANLNATVNNTTLFVWSVDREFRVITCNEPFKNYTKEYYGVDLQYGEIILPENSDHPAVETLREKWTERYKRALAGEIVKITEEMHGIIFEYSLSPIIQLKKITGVSIFCEDVTLRVQKEKELSEANKKIGEYKLMALRSVMNPHFIFNALNSIQYFILDNDKLNAINYLSTFSKLIRGVLSNSLENKIKLSEEIEQLKYYVNLEQLRFEDKFIFILNVNTDMNIHEIEIPSLLIQPYVENAILHGLCNKQGHGTLKVSISELEGTILFEIEDDGVGREAAMEYRKQNLPKHKSMGTALTEERLKLINAETNVSFAITDLMKDDEPAGTRVKIWVKEAI